jgi:hypothetical protein
MLLDTALLRRRGCSNNTATVTTVTITVIVIHRQRTLPFRATDTRLRHLLGSQCASLYVYERVWASECVCVCARERLFSVHARLATDNILRKTAQYTRHTSDRSNKQKDGYEESWVIDIATTVSAMVVEKHNIVQQEEDDDEKW